MTQAKDHALRTGDPIDPLAAIPPGHYEDGIVEVARDGALARNSDSVARTRHFSLRRNGDRVRVDHRIPPERLDNDLAGLLSDELFAPGWLSGADVFERVFTGVVKTTADPALEAWALFYDNTLARIRSLWDAEPSENCSSLEEIVPVYRRALQRVPAGRILDLGSCFGFLAMLLAERPRTEVVASDINTGTVELLRRMARHRGLTMGTLVCDSARIPLPDGAFDAVLAVHLLEHLAPEHGSAVLAEALRLARHRVVLAVPFEDSPNLAYGHVRTFDLAGLRELGRTTGEPFAVDEHHGGWLVIDREHAPSTG
jgi:SAM-dependent methyltransferase